MSHWCEQHPKYSAKRKPGSLCGKCWALFFLKNPELKPVPCEPIDFATLDVVEEGS